MDYRKLKKNEIEPSMELVKTVFDQFEAPDYTSEGVVEFYRYIDVENIVRLVKKQEMVLWGCFESDQIVGLLAVKVPDHISLLFVNPLFHRRGIAKSLFCLYLKEYKPKTVSVNSSLYAVSAYEHLGFAKIEPQKTVNGITFVPMTYKKRAFN